MHTCPHSFLQQLIFVLPSDSVPPWHVLTGLPADCVRLWLQHTGPWSCWVLPQASVHLQCYTDRLSTRRPRCEELDCLLLMILPQIWESCIKYVLVVMEKNRSWYLNSSKWGGGSIAQSVVRLTISTTHQVRSCQRSEIFQCEEHLMPTQHVTNE